MPRITKEEKRKNEEYTRAVAELSLLREELCDAYGRFDLVTDPNETEACVLTITALLSQYNNAVRNIKMLI